MELIWGTIKLHSFVHVLVPIAAPFPLSGGFTILPLYLIYIILSFSPFQNSFSDPIASNYGQWGWPEPPQALQVQDVLEQTQYPVQVSAQSRATSSLPCMKTSTILAFEGYLRVTDHLPGRAAAKAVLMQAMRLTKRGRIGRIFG